MIQVFKIIIFIFFCNPLFSQNIIEPGFFDNYGASFEPIAITFIGNCDCSFKEKDECVLLKIKINEVFFINDKEVYCDKKTLISDVEFLLIKISDLNKEKVKIGKVSFAYLGNTSKKEILKLNSFVKKEYLENRKRVAFQTGLRECGKLKKKIEKDMEDINRIILLNDSIKLEDYVMGQIRSFGDKEEK